MQKPIKATYRSGEDKKLVHTISMPLGNVFDIIYDYLTLENEADLLKNRLQNNTTKEFVRLSDYFQEKILEGTLSKTKSTSKKSEILFNYGESVQLDMPTVSSMVKASSPFVIYLKYLANKGDLIVIDEPEMNLHPKAQPQFAEFMGILIRYGVKIIITTHSTLLRRSFC